MSNIVDNKESRIVLRRYKTINCPGFDTFTMKIDEPTKRCAILLHYLNRELFGRHANDLNLFGLRQDSKSADSQGNVCKFWMQANL